jgi:hypothetical protein
MSSRSIVTLCIAFALSAGTVVAQQPPAKPAPEPPPATAPRPEPIGQPLNVRVELAITDQSGTGEALKKTVMMIAADRARASVRNDVGRSYINVDAQPQVSSSGTIRMSIGFEYLPTVTGAVGEPSRTLSRLHEQITVVLESGKPMVISQAADPASDRKVSVQVTATVMK